MKYGFVIPVYRHGSTLEAVVKSLVSYNLPIIVVDDENEDIDINLSPSGGGLPRMPKSTSDDYDIGSETAPSAPESEPQGSEEGAEETILPTPDQLGAGDFTNNDMEF